MKHGFVISEREWLFLTPCQESMHLLKLNICILYRQRSLAGTVIGVTSEDNRWASTTFSWPSAGKDLEQDLSEGLEVALHICQGISWLLMLKPTACSYYYGMGKIYLVVSEGRRQYDQWKSGTRHFFLEKPLYKWLDLNYQPHFCHTQGEILSLKQKKLVCCFNSHHL